MNRILLVFCTVVLTLNIHAQSSDSLALKVFFHQGYRYIEPDYRNNQSTLHQIKEAIDEAESKGILQHITIQAWTSPDGNSKDNERLAALRADSLSSWILHHTSAVPEKINRQAGGIGWHLLRQMLEASDVSYRNEAIRILDDTPVWVYDEQGKIISGRTKQLMELNFGTAWWDMHERFFPDICTCLAVIVQQTPETKVVKPIVADSVITEGADSMIEETSVQENGSTTPPTEGAEGQTSRPLLALKTNLLFDALLTPNIEIEFPIGNKYSVMGECWFPWYEWDGNSKAYEVLYIGAEARRWLGDRKKREVLTGHFLGLYAGGGKYDLQWDNDGYQGEFYIAAGVSYGYAHRIGKNLRLEYNIGIGFLRTDYRHYHGEENNKYLVWQNDGRYTWIGPTKAKVSLVWMLPFKKKGGKR